MNDQTMTDTGPAEIQCPKDGTTMARMGRGRTGAYTCPKCRSVFLDMPAMRSARAAQPPMWVPVVVSILMSVGMTLLVRRLRRTSKG